jgi:hypothetical protein
VVTFNFYTGLPLANVIYFSTCNGIHLEVEFLFKIFSCKGSGLTYIISSSNPPLHPEILI